MYLFYILSNLSDTVEVLCQRNQNVTCFSYLALNYLIIYISDHLDGPLDTGVSKFIT